MVNLFDNLELPDGPVEDQRWHALDYLKLPDFSWRHIMAFGLEYGYPPCCVLFFVTCYWPIVRLVPPPSCREHPFDRDIAGLHDWYAEQAKRCGLDYIPCPKCLIAALAAVAGR
jgi:hypothetical protein